MLGNILTSIVSLLIGYSLNHFGGDDRFSVLNRDKYQLESTGTFFAFIVMGIVCLAGSMAVVFAIWIIIFSNESDEVKTNMYTVALLYLFIEILGGFRAYKEAKSYNPFFTFIYYGNTFYKLLSLTDAGYLVSFVDINDDKVIISDIAKCLPIDAPTDPLSKMVPFRKKDFDKINSKKFLAKFKL